MAGALLVSADSHAQEPGDLFQTRLPTRMRDAAPRVECEGEWRVFYSGKQVLKLKPIKQEDGTLLDDFEATVPVTDRLRELDRDGVWGEVLYPGRVGAVCFALEDAEVQTACVRVYNDYVAEVFGPYRDRLCPIALLPSLDVKAAVAEIERVASLGLRGVTMPATPPEGRPYSLDIYDPIWGAAQAHGFPVSFHAVTGERPSDPLSFQSISKSVGPVAAMLRTGLATQLHVATLVASGVLERFPELQVIMVETNAGFLGYLMEALDYLISPPSKRDFASVRGIGAKKDLWDLPLMPSEYIRRQVHATFMSEVSCLANIGVTGVEPLMWGSDYPHPEGTYPHSREVTDRMFEAARIDDPAAKMAVLGGNVVKLYRFEIPQRAAVGT